MIFKTYVFVLHGLYLHPNFLGDQRFNYLKELSSRRSSLPSLIIPNLIGTDGSYFFLSKEKIEVSTGSDCDYRN